MAYRIDAERWYPLMPTHFGTALETTLLERWGPRERVFTNSRVSTDVTVASVSFLTNKDQLEALLPAEKGLELRGDPVVTVSASYMGQLRWLGGRGYNLVTVGFPVSFHGKKDQAIGSFLPVVWENMFEPIASGREYLGWSKIYADIPPARTLGSKIHTVVAWHGFKFLDMTVQNMARLSAEEVKAVTANPPRFDGSLHHKYIPRTGAPGRADADYITLSTSKGIRPTVQEIWRGEGSIAFHTATWEELPTMFHIVNTLAELENRGVVHAAMVKQTGAGMGPTVIVE